MKKILLLFALLNSGLFAQQNFQWIKTFGLSGSNAVEYNTPLTAVDNNNNVIVFGVYFGTAQFGQTVLNSSGTDRDVFISKYDPSGNILWAISAGGSGTDYVSGMDTDAADNIYLGCSISSNASFGTVTVTGITAQTACLVKLDANGVVQWVKTATGATSAMGAVAIHGNTLYATGTFTGNISLSGTSLSSVGSYDGFIASYDLSGNTTWAKSFGGTGDEDAGMTVMTSGKIFLYGRIFNSVTFGSITKNSTGDSDGFVAEVDDQGTFNWVQVFGGSGADNIVKMVTQGSSLFATGRFTGNVNFGNNQLNGLGSDVFVFRMDSAGNFEWARRFGETSASAFYKACNPFSIGVDAGGNVYSTGDFAGTHSFGSSDPSAQLTSYVNPGPGNPSSSDVYIAKLRHDGSFLEAWRLGGTADESGKSISIGTNNEIYLTGNFLSTPFLAGSLSASGPPNNFVLKMAADLTVGISKLHREESLTVYPNPTSNNLFIKSDLYADTLTIVISDVTGKVMITETIANDGSPISIEKLPKGIYFLKVIQASRISVRKIIME